MKLNPLVLFGLAGALGLVAFLATQQHLAAKTEEPRVSVLVAKAEIEVGDPVTEENSAMKEFPVSALPPKPIVKPEHWQGLYAGSRFLPGEIMVREKVDAQFGNDSRSIPPGMLTQTIKVDSTKSHAGLMRPGDRVDVYGSFQVAGVDERTGRPTKTRLIKRVLGDLELWAVGASVVGADQGGSDRDKKKDTSRRTENTVSLLVTAPQFAKLAGSEAAGTLTLALRHPDDKTDYGDIAFSTAELLSEGTDQQERTAARTAAATPGLSPAATTAARPAASAASGGVAAFLDAEAAPAPAAPAARRAEDVPTWTLTLHSGRDSTPTEVVDLAAAVKAGFTPAQIAAKRRYLADPNSAPAVAAVDPLAAGFGAPGGFGQAPPAAPPTADPTDAADANAAAPSALAPPVEGEADRGDGGTDEDLTRQASAEWDGLYPAPE